ncbi:hypothetical protein PVE_R2G1015 [Pseudomonas veronii 1YdBTEX2]|uniref:Uncharacterized protein n=1 Tax=Pseudomonas veronii 1YdBTEX2 TaxID=1295141 RepID=A0A1D3K613_PSEVE|nr:hypothetical protein [Pseudomonas veronii]SBW83712.1 hypothetical protein PVE_R1G5832 [Pseudomonas veronii 1YdBTEX2]SBW85040.1 hypothetical protein PVE_R2G1015 [Pseudomonas veronii 1YdBTEX2]
MHFIPQLADDTRIWEILGIRDVSFLDGDPSALSLQFFCFSDEDPPARSKRWVSVLNLPVTAIKHVKPGSRWKNGEQLKPVTKRYRQARPVDPSKAKLRVCKKYYSEQELIKKISNARDPHLAFIKQINHIFYRGPHYTVRIPCSELIRYFLFPTFRYGKSVLTGKFEDFVGINSAGSEIPQKRATEREVLTTNFLTSSGEGIRAARHPFKMLKISNINRETRREYSPISLSAIFPTANFSYIKMKVTAGTPKDTVAVQIYTVSIDSFKAA